MKRTKWPKTVTVFGREVQSTVGREWVWTGDGRVVCEAWRLRDVVCIRVAAGLLSVRGYGKTLPAAIADAESNIEAEWSRIGELLGYEVTR